MGKVLLCSSIPGRGFEMGLMKALLSIKFEFSIHREKPKS